jgi:hypothetical protein
MPSSISQSELESYIGTLDLFFEKLQTASHDGDATLLEQYFALCNTDSISFTDLVRALCHTRLWQGFEVFDNPYPKLCQDFAQSVEHGSQIMQPEPAYHSRAHFKDVCLALSALASQVSFNGEGEEFDQRWQLSSEDWWILLFCAIAHDYGHPGTRNQTPFELEKYAVDLTHEFLLQSSYPLLKIKSLMADLEPTVLATDPRYLNTLSCKFLNQDHPNSRTDLMGLLLVEADLCASALPRRGTSLGEQLAKEWEASDAKLAQIVKSDAGRIRFLEGIAFYSPHARRLHIETIRLNSIQALKVS